MKLINLFTVASLTTLVGVAGASQLAGCKEGPTAAAPATPAAMPVAAPAPAAAAPSTPAPVAAVPSTPAPAAAPAPAVDAAANAAKAAVDAAKPEAVQVAQAGGEKKTDLYSVVDGYKVDAKTMDGFRTWRAAACDRCHGANQEGLVGPSLVTSLKTLSKEEFVKVVRDGRLDKGMQSFGNSKQVMDNLDNLWAYLKGRSDGAITRSKVEENK